jgi:uncharacterized protein (DUF2141 family)
VTGLSPATFYYFRPVSHGSPEVVGVEVGTSTLAAIPTRGAIVVTKNTLGGNGTFTFQGPSGIFAITTTGGTGQSTIANLLPGTYSITENAEVGWTLTGTTCNNINVVAGATTTCVVTNTIQGGGGGSTTPGVITGRKWEDKNGNGIWNSGEGTLAGWTIYIDKNDNGRLDRNERSTVTGPNGVYTFSNLQPGNYVIREVMKEGWMQITPASGKYTVTLASGQGVQQKDFGNFKKGKISTYVFDDRNGNGYVNRGEKGLKDWQVRLRLPDGSWITKSTDKDGYAEFSNLGPGSYTLRETVKSGWTQTSTNPASITITSGKESHDNDFGNKKN